jgi:hypothetical protein
MVRTNYGQYLQNKHNQPVSDFRAGGTVRAKESPESRDFFSTPLFIQGGVWNFCAN